MEKPKILIVDDRPENLLTLETIFEDEPCETVRALSGNEALAKAVSEEFAMVLLDVQMPEMDGFETAELMRSNPKTRHIPIIFVTAISKEKKFIFQGYASGAVDYLLKPLEPEILKNKVKIFLDLYQQKKTIEKTNAELQQANKKILNQQKELMEEERLKVLLQMAGATAHELNQPLMTLLGNIELLRIGNDIPEKIASRLSKIEASGQRIADIVKRIQTIEHDQIKTYPGGEQIIDIHPKEDILWVEDDDHIFEIFKRMTEKKRTVNIERAVNIEQAKQILLENNYDLAVLDLKLPDGDAFELLKFIKKNSIKICILVITGYGDEEIAVRCLREGAHAYLPKGNINIDILNNSIDEALEKFRLDMDKEKAVAKMAEMATVDELTKLHNRRYMQEVLGLECNRLRRYGGDLSCLLIDIDLFKQVNDSFGHDCGDFILKEVSDLLRKNIRDTDSAFRYGGEEFLILLPHTNIDEAFQTAEKIRKKCESVAYNYHDNTLQITISIGIASTRSCSIEKTTDLIPFADKALYQAKADGRNCTRCFPHEAAGSSKKLEKTFGKKSITYVKQQVESILKKTKNATLDSIKLLIKNMEDGDIVSRNQKAARYITLISDKLHLPDNDKKSIVDASMLHDCFNHLIGNDLLLKKEQLSKHERKRIKKHPHMIQEIIELFDFFSNEKVVIASHHENYDGSGYPSGLTSDQIPLGARIFTIADALNAMISPYPYKISLSPETVLSELVDNAGIQFDPHLVKLTIDIIQENKLLDLPCETFDEAREKIESRL